MPNKKKLSSLLQIDMRRSPTINIAHYKWKILNFFIYNNYTSSPSPASPKTGQKKNLLVREMVINIKCNKLAQAVPVEICEPFPNIKILFLEGGRGAIWQSTIDKVQSIICVFFWRKNATENFQSFLFLTVNSRIHFWWLFLPSMLKSSKF